MSVHLPSKIQLARIPTPIEPLERLSREWGVDLWIKRDDLTGTELTGNKIRKLEYLLSDAITHNCDIIVTCGATTSNHARATAIAARKLGLNCLLILAGDPPAYARGNLQLDLLIGAEVRYITREQYTDRIEQILLETENELKNEGKNPYIIPTGGSNSVGLLGYVEAVEEVKSQCAEMNWKPDFLVCAVGSGGTYAGLFLGNVLHEMNCSILGTLVCGSIPSFEKKIMEDIQEACKRYDFACETVPKNIRLIDGYIAGGYAKTNSEQLEFIRHVAQEEAVILEPVYTGKTFFGMYKEIQASRIPKESKILFFHTGGIFGLSAFAEQMTREWNSVSFWPDYF